MTNFLSRVEAILRSKIDGTAYNKKPMSRVEELLLELNTTGGDADLTEVNQRLDVLETNLNQLVDNVTSELMILGRLMTQVEKKANASILDSSYVSDTQKGS